MKLFVSMGTLLAAFALAGCDESKEEATPQKAETGSAKSDAPKLILGPQSPVPPIEPSPVPSLPANVKEGMERKDPEPGPDMGEKAKPPETKAPIEATTPRNADAPK